MSKITRRSFVATSAQGAGAVAAAASVLGAQRAAAAESPNEKVVLGLIGAGGRGRMVIKNMAKLQNVEVKYVCDVEDARGKNAVAELDKIQGSAPALVKDMREVLDDKDVNAVVVATPEHWHALATVWACQAGKDVYVEKPVSHNVSEGRRMVQVMEKYQRICQGGTQHRSTGQATAAAEYVRQGKLGQIKLARCFMYRPRNHMGPLG